MVTLDIHHKIQLADASGNYKLQVRGSNLGGEWVDIYQGLNLQTSGEYVITTIDVDGSMYIAGSVYQFKIYDIDTGVESLPLTYKIPLPLISEITSYTAGRAQIEFLQAGSNDEWLLRVSNYTQVEYNPNGATMTNFEGNMSFSPAYGNSVNVYAWSNHMSGPVIYPTGGYGAGFYVIQALYTYSDGTGFSVCSVYRVDANTEYVAKCDCKGFTVLSVSGLTIEVKAEFEALDIAGGSQNIPLYPIWLASEADDNAHLMNTGDNPATFTIPTTTSYICYGLNFNDFPQFDGFTADFFGFMKMTLG